METLLDSLTSMSFENACVLYQQKAGVYPTTLGVSHSDLENAYEIITETKSKMLVVPIPGLPIGDWFVCGGSLTIYSEVE